MSENYFQNTCSKHVFQIMFDDLLLTFWKLFDDFLSTFCQLFVDFWSTFGWLLVDFWSTCCRLLVDFWSTVCRLFVNFWYQPYIDADHNVPVALLTEHQCTHGFCSYRTFGVENIFLSWHSENTCCVGRWCTADSTKSNVCAQRSLRSSDQKFHLVQSVRAWVSLWVCEFVTQKSRKNHALKVN